jgi:hypothetical protein
VPASSLSEPVLLNKERLAARYNVKIRTIDYWVAKGFIPVIKIGRLDRFYAPECDKIILAKENRRPAASEKQPRKVRVKRCKNLNVGA